MEENLEMQAALQQLDHELEEGDITHKGYEKRRSVVLSQFMPPQEALPTQRGLRVHSPQDSSHLAAKSSNGSLPRILNVGKREGAYADGSIRSRNSSLDYPHAHTQRAQEREPTLLRQAQRQSSYASYDSQMLQYQNRPPTESSPAPSRSQTLLSQHFAFNPDPGMGRVEGGDSSTRHSTMLDAQQQYFLDFTGQQMEDQQVDHEAVHRYSQLEPFSPAAQIAPPLIHTGDLPGGGSSLHQMPLEPRDIPFNVCDPHNHNIEMSKFDNIAMVLRHRAKVNSKQPAFWVLDPKGKELVSITWEKLASRAEKVAQVIRDKSSLYKGDRVALIYRDSEVTEFAVALMGCFIAGVVAVPINDLKDYRRLNVVLTSAQAHLALTTEANLKNFQRDITAAKLNWPRGVEWWKTNEFGSFHPKKKGEEPPLVVPDLAYIEFSTAPTGDLRGVVMSHRTIMHQMSCLSAIISTAPLGSGDTFNPALRDKQGKSMSSGNRGETILSYLDARESIGMILGLLLDVYGGHTTIWVEAPAVETPGLYASLITKYRATLLIADYPRLKRAVYNYQSDPMATRNFKKGVEPNFSTVRLCLIDTLTVDSEFHELLADRWLRPLRNPRAREVVAPMLCLQEHGGMVVSVRDWLGGEEHMGCPLVHQMGEEDTPTAKDHEDTSKSKAGFGSSLIGGTTAPPSKRDGRTYLGEVLLDKEALKTNEVVVSALGAEAREKQSSHPGTLRCGAFGYPIPDATLAIVDPETSLLCRPNTIGEIWVDSPSLSGGFWALPKHTDNIFHARPYQFKEGNPTPVLIEPEFLRTGLLGTVIEGKVFVLGLYEDRLRQRVEWVEHGLETQEHRYFFVQHLISSIMKNVPKIHDCSAFDICVNEEHLPIVLIESYAASTAPLASGGPPRQLDLALLDSLSERCMEVLLDEHHLRVYCVMITAPNTLPRITKNGRDEIGNMRCRREFDNGSLPCEHVKFGVERAVLNLPVGEDPVGGIWSPSSTAVRQELLKMQEKQYSGVDPRTVVIDDRTSTPLNNFTSIVDLMQWRVARQADELAYCTVDGRGREGKGLAWKKFDQRVASVAMYLKNKAKIRPFDHVILMYTHSEDFVFAIYACLCLGAVAIPVAPLDQNRLAEDAPAFLHIVADMTVRCVIVNAEVDNLLKQKIVSQHLKQSASVLKINVPPVYSTAKTPKQSQGCRGLGLKMSPSWISPTSPALIWTYWTPDQRRVSVQLGHDTILGMCKVQKETCQMSSSRPVLGCVRSTTGLGFIYTCLMGVFMGAPTYLISPVDFAQNPQCLFLSLARYKIKDTYATSQMLEFAMSTMPAKGFSLQELQNLMIATDSRPQTDIYKKVRLHFAQSGLERTAINTIYSHVLNPMIASRSYMSIEPIELWLDIRALRRGLVYPIDTDTNPDALLVQDCGMVPVSTQIAIVNPETCQLCHVGEYGEIWVQSEACAKSFYMSRQEFDLERFNARIVGGDPDAVYVRTGDLGFLHVVHRPIGAGGQTVEMQVLFNLGGIGETFEINGLNHFPADIERSVEMCHRNISPGGSAVFQAGGLVVVVVEVFRKAYLASMVPVIVGAILHDHQLVVDMIAFVSNGDFPRSRLGEKQRGKILASWVTRKLRIVGQFGIRDLDNAVNQITELPEPRLRPNNASLLSRSFRSRGDMARTSIVSESPAHMGHQQGSRPNIGEGPASSSAPMPQTSHSPYANSRAGHAGLPRAEQNPPGAPAVVLNDQPYALPDGRVGESASRSHLGWSGNDSEPADDSDQGYDHNATSDYSYRNRSPQPSSSYINTSAQDPLPHLTVMNSSDAPLSPEDSISRTPTESMSPYGQSNYEHAYDLSDPTTVGATSSTTPTARTGYLPAEDPENPYSEYYHPSQDVAAQNGSPETTPSVGYTPAAQSSISSPSPPPPISKFTPPLQSPSAGGGRATLPSQQQRSRYSSYSSLPGLAGSAGLRTPNNEVSSPPATTYANTAAQEGEEPMPREALMYASRSSPMRSSDEADYAEEVRSPQSNRLDPGQIEGRKSDAGSVAGSVRRRYDGSEYDGW